MFAVEELEEFARGGIIFRRDFLGASEIADWPAGIESCALEDGGQEAVPPAICARLRNAARIRDRDKCRQVIALAAERVRHPCAGTRKPIEGEAGAHEIFTGA